MPWSRPFEDPILLLDGREIPTLSDARAYILDLPESDQQAEEWQAAVEALIMAADGNGPLLHARVGLLRALNRHQPVLFNPSRKDPHWGSEG